MIKIPIDKAKPGIKIVKDIVNESGMIVVPAGKELTESLIDKLSMMNIDFIYVEGKKELPPKDEVLNEIEKRFKKINDEPTLLIKRALEAHIEDLYNER
ncbi:MAG TPA: hypothetical protein PKZ17_00085 [Thermodesulfovibrio thiophilus]|uniref:hypothetical protein n=1 Tax=Thermodesulfovibrio thiophilus TaxID=340095 RepID=UPI00041B6212|nr:hypothetical protein [Thermodesulfovibrio thiophilus]HHW19916.1 hypothetical protein [Thermodesulfovibrio thiophilus]HOA82487.1 hypothetical protein [Thermodesulfovibrio thiophilus]HQA03116.1 hypothetical protein [Thermodesulfovibrio thiophilus]HQD35477.1 hypothetical protein [Thermodesulfovibrio thiophilus]